jgi:hypothetical protein
MFLFSSVRLVRPSFVSFGLSLLTACRRLCGWASPCDHAWSVALVVIVACAIGARSRRLTCADTPVSSRRRLCTCRTAARREPRTPCTALSSPLPFLCSITQRCGCACVRARRGVLREWAECLGDGGARAPFCRASSKTCLASSLGVNDCSAASRTVLPIQSDTRGLAPFSNRYCT